MAKTSANSNLFVVLSCSSFGPGNPSISIIYQFYCLAVTSSEHATLSLCYMSEYYYIKLNNPFDFIQEDLIFNQFVSRVEWGEEFWMKGKVFI